jgi:hypothetical protein
MKYFLSISLFFLFSLNLTAQNLDEVFDDGGLSTVKNNVTFNASDLVEGFISFGYNRYLGQRFSIGLSVGIYAYQGFPLHLPNDHSFKYYKIDNFDRGFMFHLKFRRYWSDHEGFFWQYGILYRKKVLNNTDYTFTSLPEIKLGYRFNIYQHLYLSASAGWGFGFYGIKSSAYRSSVWNVSDVEWYMPLNIEVAYDF